MRSNDLRYMSDNTHEMRLADVKRDTLLPANSTSVDDYAKLYDNEQTKQLQYCGVLIALNVIVLGTPIAIAFLPLMIKRAVKLRVLENNLKRSDQYTIQRFGLFKMRKRAVKISDLDSK